jgi:hypothetical protein
MAIGVPQQIGWQAVRIGRKNMQIRACTRSSLCDRLLAAVTKLRAPLTKVAASACAAVWHTARSQAAASGVNLHPQNNLRGVPRG